MSKAIPFLEGLPCDSLYFILDLEVDRLHADRLAPLLGLVDPHNVLRLTGGEASKGVDTLIELWRWLSERTATRSSCVVTIGGGALSDVVGFASATYMRGITTINIPTTLLAMVDASVGGKTAIDFAGVKNLVGAFHEPREVLIDTCFLDTLSLDELYSGYAELMKTALLSGREMWSALLRAGDPQMWTGEEWQSFVERAVAYKAMIVAKDPHEQSGERHALNLGHTIGHALEAFSVWRATADSYSPHSDNTHVPKPLLHGEAVAIGLIIETYMAMKYCGAPMELLRQIVAVCREYYPQYHYSCKDYPTILKLMRQDKKNEANSIHFMLLSELGEVRAYRTDDDKQIIEALDFYRETFGG